MKGRRMAIRRPRELGVEDRAPIRSSIPSPTLIAGTRPANLLLKGNCGNRKSPKTTKGPPRKLSKLLLREPSGDPAGVSFFRSSPRSISRNR